MMKKHKRSLLVILLLILTTIIIYAFNVANNLKVDVGSQVKKETDIVLAVIPTDIIDIISQENITDAKLESISGELRIAIFLHTLPIELQVYLKYLTDEFNEYKDLYQRSVNKQSTELSELKQELLETCYKGKELHSTLGQYLDNDDYNVKYKMWYKVYNDKNHDLRKLIVDILGEERVSCSYYCK